MVKKIFALVLLVSLNSHAACAHTKIDAAKTAVVATAAQAKDAAKKINSAAAEVVAPKVAATKSVVVRAKDKAAALVTAIWNATYGAYPKTSTAIFAALAALGLYQNDTVKKTVRGVVGCETEPCKSTCPATK